MLNIFYPKSSRCIIIIEQILEYYTSYRYLLLILTYNLTIPTDVLKFRNNLNEINLSVLFEYNHLI